MNKPHAEKRALLERMKELNCLYDISSLFSHHSLSLERLLREIVKAIPRAWQYPARTCVRISYGEQEYRSKNYSSRSTSLTETIRQNNRPCGCVEVGCLEKGSGTSGPVFLEDEKRLLKAIAELLGNILEKKEAEQSLKRTTCELRRQTRELEDKNTALKEIISQFESEKEALQARLRTNIELTVFPLLGRMLDSTLPPEGLKNCVSVVRQNLEDVTSSVSRAAIDDRTRLSPREFEICNLVRNGQPNKRIAELLQISLLTVERHRHNIRKKLRIDNEHVNLSTFLRSR
jgi:DNA-binding CsgD family transcriptional regulator/FtsZ-binding cell division protein ZapB